MNKIGFPCNNNIECINKNCVNNVCTRRNRITRTLKTQKNKINFRCLDNSQCINKNCVNNICTRRNRASKKHIKQSKSMKTIQKFMLSTKHERKSHYLKNICSDSGLCIAFGIENKKIKSFFNDFVMFDYVIPPIIQLGSSSNGFINEILFQHRGYKAYAVLKSSTKKDADNLWFEYMVGLQVNNWSKYLPCFVETYGLFKYNNDVEYNRAKTTKNITDTNFLNDALQLVTTQASKNQVYDYADICKNSKYYAILIQHICASSFSSKEQNMSVEDRMTIMAQVYIPLATLTNVFVHNDLHTDNVMLYQAYPGKYIHFFYYDTKDSVPLEFHSYYVVKIIDYGRSYISNGVELKQKLCDTRECDPECGDNYGFGWMNDRLTAKNYYISSIKKNQSHDLRLLFSVFPNLVKYGNGISKANYKQYGTRPMSKETTDGLISNVSGAKSYIKQYLTTPENIRYFSGNNFPPDKKIGELHVYLDLTTPTRFVKV
jgi:hypothetical protein